MSIQRDELHRLIDQLPDSEVTPALRYLRYLRDLGEDPLMKQLSKAPLDDEPESPGEREGADQARQEMQQGQLFTNEELERELGL
ncbi:hypothetical protein [Alicyclobacillus hesperidum]|uniref:hypothetical protein n=1 Tax=Alicyclobacillus hesperidum TaxID=89784 RepID=UPI00030ED84B|nr:hypothetical protein [Alicyclobacillus hesperidum]